MTIEYDQIINRFSVRRYQQAEFEISLLDVVEKMTKNTDSLFGNDNFSCGIYKYDSRLKTSGALGLFGKIFSAPYFLAPFTLGGTDKLLDLGFRTQQIVLDHWLEGIGSCYIGCVHQQKRVIDLLDLPKGTRVVSMVAFGTPAENQSKYLYQKVSQAFTRSKQRLEYGELFLDGSNLNIEDFSVDTKKIIEAGRQSPSATNSQPWRFRINKEYLEIFAMRKNTSSLYDLDQEYTLHDVGICMANMSRAARALGKEISWDLYPIADQNPKEKNIRVARFKIKP
jgi:hypothetical protein